VKIKFIVLSIIIVVLLSFTSYLFLSQIHSKSTLQLSNEIAKTKLDIRSLFDIYGLEDNFEMKNGTKVWRNVTFELNPENSEIYKDLSYDSKENTVVIFPIFTMVAYHEPGFYTYYRGECDQKCLTIKIQKEYLSDFNSSGNGVQVLKLLGYPIISDIDVDQNPSILAKYDKVILLHNEYVTQKEFDAITNHPKVIYLYPNALYAKISVDYLSNSMTLLSGHNFPQQDILNGFNWKFDNSELEYDINCKEMGFDKIVNGWMLNCYPESAIHQSKVLLKMIKDF